MDPFIVVYCCFVVGVCLHLGVLLSEMLSHAYAVLELFKNFVVCARHRAAVFG